MPLSQQGFGGGATSLFRAGGGASLFNFNSFTFLSGDESYSRVPSGNPSPSPRNTTLGDFNSGPTKNELINHYNTSANTWLNNATFYDVDGNGFQKFVIPQTGSYEFTVQGSRGGAGGNGGSLIINGGYGRSITGRLSLTINTEIYMLVGKAGESAAGPNQNCGGGGGGGSYVWLNVTDTYPLFAAGGGGGGGTNSTGDEAPNSENGTTPSGGSQSETGGTAGGIGSNLYDANYDAGGGAGWLAGNGEVTVGNDCTFGYAPRNGGNGGFRSADASDDHGGHGGFGGGGGGTTSNGNGGGGGGYSGGGSQNGNNGGGAGGSYISSSATNTSSTVSSLTHGKIQITKV
tara:strand:- start:1989 stop:3026 length:1038 start_codon:yes stop_codon:yes gene_type:complete